MLVLKIVFTDQEHNPLYLDAQEPIDLLQHQIDMEVENSDLLGLRGGVLFTAELIEMDKATFKALPEWDWM